MPTTLAITKPVGKAIVAPSIRWPPGSRLSPQDQAAFGAYTKEVEVVIRSLAEAVRELQDQLDKKAIG